MIEMSLASILVIAGLLMTFFAYVASVSYRLGRTEQRVESNEKAIEDMKLGHATRTDIDNLKETLSDLKDSISKLFELLRFQDAQRIKRDQP